MSAGALKRLTIEHLRGSVVPFSMPFEKGKKLTVIYGENAAGKSTICDAFEFLGKGRVGSLENRGLGKTNRYWHSLGKTAGDISVSLEMASSTCRATISNSDVIAAPPEARPRVEVLRRIQILSLIQAKPGDRYAAISQFIDVSGVEAGEATLRQLIRDLNDSRGTAVARVQENGDAIRQFWETARKPAKDPFVWAKAEAARDADAFDGEINALSALQSAYSRLTEYPERFKSAEQALRTATESASTAKAHAEASLRNISKDADQIVGVLQAAQAYLFKYPSPAACPLCESAEKTTGTQARAAEQVRHRAEQQVQMLRESAKQHVAGFEKSRAQHSWPSDITLPASAAPEDSSDLLSWLTATAHLPGEWKAAETTRHDNKQFITTLKKALKTWLDNTEAQKQLDHLLPQLRRALEIVEEERRRFTDNVLAKIAEEVGRLYEAVHPGEGLNKISLALDPERRASLKMGASFCGQSTLPQAYFSDSHLDTLALCVFLALAALDQPESTILVLDDVLASVDEPHVERLIEMLYTEALRFRHCVITTHYGPWKHKFRWGWLKHDRCQFIELTKWTPATGLTLIRSVPEIERLKEMLAESPPDLTAICSKAGLILEAALEFLTLHYECHAPRRASGVYTLGELLPAVDKKLRQSLRVEILDGADADGIPIYKTVNLGTFLDELSRISQVRNVVGCHFNAISFDLLDTDALGFGQQVLGFVDALTDTEAGWPKNGKSGEYWSTFGETRRLRPFKKPS